MRNVLLLSGGIDSSALAARFHPDAAAVVDYGQLPAKGEIRSATAVAEALDIPIHIIKADCSRVGSGILSGQEPAAFAPSREWWPFRNQMIITLVAAWAVQRGVRELLVGTVKGDNRHADGTVQFYNQIDALCSIQEGGLRVRAPAIDITSIELIKTSGIPEEILGWTHSCHQSEWACGDCPGCYKHIEVLSELKKML